MYEFKSLEPSALATKKLAATFLNKETGKTKTVNFGAKGYRDYTIIEDKAEAEKARASYRARHAKDNLNDPTSPGALSMWILWGDSRSINTNLSAYRKHFKI